MTIRLRDQGRHHRPRTWSVVFGDWFAALDSPAGSRKLTRATLALAIGNLAGVVVQIVQVLT